MDEKQFAINFDDLYDGADPILALGLSYEEGSDQIRIEDKSYFYDKTPIVNLGNIYRIVRTYDQAIFYKTVEIGFEDWSLESTAGIDDPQSRRTYRTRFKNVGEDLKILSKFLGASLAIEQTRRNSVDKNKDWRGDEKIMVIAVKPDGFGGWTPETGLDFDDVQNLLNFDARYNVRIGCAQNFKRWLSWLSNCLAEFPDKYYFAKGEGNYEMIVTRDANDCDFGAGIVAENQDHQTSNTDFVKLPRRYAFEYPMTFQNYKFIRANRTKAIGLSRGTANFTPHFIQRLEFTLARGKADFLVDLAEIPTPTNGFKYLEDDNFVIFGTEGLLYLDGEDVLFVDGETAVVPLDS